MHIESAAFGSIDVEADQIIEFPAGLPGFEACKRFTFLQTGDKGAVLQMQGVDDPAIVFSVTDPAALGVNYELTLSDADVAALGLTQPEDATVAVIVRQAAVDAGSPADAGLKANFMAPLVVNTATRRGIQKVLEQVGCEITLRGQ
ncbi:MAG: flagellar biosynthesis protein FliW [Denitromonas halophila]|jgi:flagellar assembly factor FliW|nr:MAG: flagellar biosynthesis protein FliW [Denitromonas halophila]TVT67074.1 MAG: flagellar biosynthesis protein FliW [Denitromonas halophila]TVT78538.1 MAG: flagellar biosynthesis protein FliW [Denitromonas halophila]